MSIGPEQRAMLDVLAMEYAAVFCYGIIAAYALPGRDAMVAADITAHRALRDAMIDRLDGLGIDIPPAPAGYQLPFAVLNPTDAAKLAVSAETDAATAWRSLIERAQSESARATGVDGLTETAGRLARWRQIAGVTPATVALPGAGT